MQIQNPPGDMVIRGNVVDIMNRRTAEADVVIANGLVKKITWHSDQVNDALPFIMPGFIDAHIHIESSMLTPCGFAKIATTHGTVATISDPHEIANVLGIDGIEFMLASAAKVPMKFFFGCPACVPATAFETSGASIDAADVARLMARDDIRYLAEMMNYPGVLTGDVDVLAKIRSAIDAKKPVDGHAPGLIGDQARRYIAAGITTDHECVSFDEAIGKLRLGMKILIREGSAAKNFEALKSLIDFHAAEVMLCSDDKHPDELIHGHINQLVARAVADGIDVYRVLRAACINPIDHYSLSVGRLRTGDAADFIIVKDLKDFSVLKTFIDGVCVARDGESLFDFDPDPVVNRFACAEKRPNDFRILTHTDAPSVDARVIEAFDGELITGERIMTLRCIDSRLEPDVDRDILKFAVVNRYVDAPPAVALIHGFGMRRGAIASSVGHDSHNILAVGCDDESICRAVNAVIQHRGGVCAFDPADHCLRSLPLPIAGIMSASDGREVAAQYHEVETFAKQQLGSTLTSPFMTLSFMALLVIPKLKLSDRGLFDGERFEFVDLLINDMS